MELLYILLGTGVVGDILEVDRDEHPYAKRGLFCSHGELCVGCYDMVSRHIHTGCGCIVSTVRQMAGGKMHCEEADKGGTCVEGKCDRVAESSLMPSSDS